MPNTMIEKTTLSVIVPVFSTERYLPRCIESVLSQAFTDYKMILVDDGSTDGCSEICDEYVEHDERLIVVHQKNEGVSSARNAGLDIANGEYLGFVDSDDLLERNCYELLVQTAINGNYDIVAGGYRSFKEDGKCVFESPSLEGKYSRLELLENQYTNPNPFEGALCNKVIVRRKIEDIRFREDVTNYEDGIYITECIGRLKYGKKIAERVYCVNERVGSASRCTSASAIPRILYGLQAFVDVAQRNDMPPSIRSKAYSKLFDDCMRCMANLDGKAQINSSKWCITSLRVMVFMMRNLYIAISKKVMSKKQIHASLSAIIHVSTRRKKNAPYDSI